MNRTRVCAAGRLPAPTPGPGTGSPSRPTSASRTEFDNAIADFAETYADQNERDHAALAAAVAAGESKRSSVCEQSAFPATDQDAVCR